MEASSLRLYILTFSLICQWAYQNSATTCRIFIVFFVSMASINVILYFKCYGKSKQLVVPHAALPPGPAPWPLVGCLPTMWRKKPRYRWIHTIMEEFNTDIACIRLGNIHVIPVSSPELALEFLKTHDSVFASRPVTVTTRMFSGGFLTAVVTPWGDQWKKMRRVLTSQILSPSRLHWMRDKRTEEADNLVRYIFSLTANDNGESKSRGGAVINMRSITQHYCGNIIRRMLFNRRYYSQGREDGGPTVEEEEHIQALFTILVHVYAFCVSDYMPCLKAFDLDGHKKIMKKALKVVRKYDDPIIDERAQQWKDGTKKEVEDLLDIFITLKDENDNPLLSIKEIKAQITELLLATVDNPSNTVEWAMAELLNQPKILEKAIEELDRVVGRDRLVQESDIPHLKYLMACLREALRLHPLAPFNLPHTSQSDVVVSGYFIPKGSQILLSRLGLGRNPKIWEDPMRFNPERHLKDETIKLGLSEPNMRFISFTRGRRGCIGSSLGTTIMMMLFARLLQGFSWNLPLGMTEIDLSESDELFLMTPLHLYAEPRLPQFIYSTI